MSFDLFIKIASIICPLIFTAYATIVIIKERQKRGEIDNRELKDNVDDFVKEFRNCINVLNATSERQRILQKLTNDTLTSMITKLEHLDTRVNANTTTIAVLKEKVKLNAN